MSLQILNQPWKLLIQSQIVVLILTDGIGYCGKILPKRLRLRASLEGNTRQGYSQYDSVVPTVWQVLYILTSVSLTVKSKQSCGSVLIFLQRLLPVSKSVQGADTSGISPKSVTAGIQTSLVSCFISICEKKKKEN